MALTEDKVSDKAKGILGFEDSKDVISDVGQLTTFNQLGFKGVSDKPDGWYLPKDKNLPALILEAKSSDEDISKEKWENEILKNCRIAQSQYKNVLGILYNGKDVRAFKNREEIPVVKDLQNKEYYLGFFNKNKIDKHLIYGVTKQINDSLHIDFGIKNLYHRMIFTACALVATRYGAKLSKGMSYDNFKFVIHETLSNALAEAKRENDKLSLLLEVYKDEIKMNSTKNQEAIDGFIDNVRRISLHLNSDFWNGEDVMGIFFNEFNRYKKKSERGQVFTPDHITSLMYRLINVNKDDVVLDAACGSGAFLVKAMCNMIKEAGGVKADKTKEIKSRQLYGIEFDREIFALACANMLIHKDGKTNLEQFDSRTEEAADWIKSKPITKVLMNPPFETKFGCIDIVKNVLDSVKQHTMCAFILPDKKLEKVSKAKKILDDHTLQKIIKLPENTFNEGVTTSIFIFEAGIPQNGNEILTCYIENDGLETVKNQGRQDIKDKWQEIEDYWIDEILNKRNDETINWIKPSEHLSYQMPEKPFEIYEEDFVKTVMDYMMFEQGIDTKEFEEKLMKKVMYSSSVNSDGGDVVIRLGEKKDGQD